MLLLDHGPIEQTTAGDHMNCSGYGGADFRDEVREQI